MALDVSNKPVRVAVDVMGGDCAPQEIIKGAIQAARKDGTEVLLVGLEDVILNEMREDDISTPPIHVVHASEVIREGESPVAALRHKPDASVLVAMNLLKEGEADAVISMGATGATIVSAIGILGKFAGIRRPVMGGFISQFAPNTIAFDLGANVDCKPRELMNFAVIGSVVTRKMLHISNPTVALLNNGAEEGKGNKATKEAYQLFKESKLNFIGNIESINVLVGKANVVICDGFMGNMLLKFCEGLGDSTIAWLRTILDKRLSEEEINTITAELFALTHTADVHGGGIVYGVNGVVLVGHGRSEAPQVIEAIRQVRQAVEVDLLPELKSELEKLP